jgi:hypothetical protein
MLLGNAWSSIPDLDFTTILARPARDDDPTPLRVAQRV